MADLKCIKKYFRNTKSFRVRQLFYAGKTIWMLLRSLASARYRAELLTRRKFHSNHFQQSTATRTDRYPILFAMAAHYLAGKSDVRILSFGCSTGEEVYSLGSYFPTSQITGVDINEWCIRQCRKKYLDKQFSFFHTFSSEFASSEPFDAIFCMAVFQRSEKNELTDGSYLLEFTFSQFESELVKLGSNLKPGGLLVIDHCDFNFQDTKCAINYAPLPFEKNQLLRNRPLFDKYNRKIADRQNNYRMFKKK